MPPSSPVYLRLDDGVRQSPRSRRLLLTGGALLLLLFLYWNSANNNWISTDGVSNGIYRLLPLIVDSNFTMEETATEKAEYGEPFKRRTETSHVDCQRAIEGDRDYMRTIASSRPVIKTSYPPMDCVSLQTRILPPRSLPPTSFGIAFARVVFRDYEFIEDEVRSLFHPENLFCFVLDSKTNRRLRSQMKQLATCFPNIFIAPREVEVDSFGHGMNEAHLECLKVLNKKPHWEYVLLLQNHDVVLRTTYELVEVYKAMGGANDVEITKSPEDRWDQTLEWDARTLRLFRNESQATKKQLEAKITIAKGAVQASLSRKAVQWMVATVDLTILIDRLNNMEFGVDELLIPSLQISDDLEMPGRFTHQCLDKGHKTDFVSRMSHWEYENPSKCATGLERHAICILGLEDLPSLMKYPNLVANKFLPDFDYAGLDCLHEVIFNRTYSKNQPFDTSYYSNMVNVRYHHRKRIVIGKEPPLECLSKDSWEELPYN